MISSAGRLRARPEIPPVIRKLNVNEGGPSRGRLYAGLAFAGAAALISIGLVIGGLAGPDPEPRPLTDGIPAPLRQPETAPTSAPRTTENHDPASNRLADAFESATGHRTGYSFSRDGSLVSIRPLKIIRLPFGPALLTEEDIKDACHPCGGAIGVYYLRESGGKLEVTGRWPRAVEGWDWGDPPSTWELTDRFTTYPAMYATGDFMAQGVIVSGARITELRPSGPATSDLIGTSYDDEGNRPENEVACVVKGRVANIRKDRSFDVIVTGSANAVDRYEKRNGRFVARKKIRWNLPCGYPDNEAG